MCRPGCPQAGQYPQPRSSLGGVAMGRSGSDGRWGICDRALAVAALRQYNGEELPHPLE